jgi:hypothetical protein
LRATAQKIKVPSQTNSNGLGNGNVETSRAREDASKWEVRTEEPPLLLQFSPATTSEELREVREILASSPGRRRVQLLFDRPNGEPLRVDAGIDLQVNLTREVEQKLMRWLVTTKADRRDLGSAA